MQRVHCWLLRSGIPAAGGRQAERCRLPGVGGTPLCIAHTSQRRGEEGIEPICFSSPEETGEGDTTCRCGSHAAATCMWAGGARVICGSCASCASAGLECTLLPAGRLGGGGHVCVPVFSVLVCTPFVCVRVCICGFVRAAVVSCVPNLLVCVPCSMCVGACCYPWMCNHACSGGEQCMYTCVLMGVSVCLGVLGRACLSSPGCLCAYLQLCKISWHSPGLPRAQLQENREAQYSSFPCRQPKLLLPKPWGRLPTWDVLGERLSWPGVAEHRERGDLLHPVRRTSPIDLRKAGLVPGIFSPLTVLIPSGLPLLLASWLLLSELPAASFVPLGQCCFEKEPSSKKLMMQRHPQCKEEIPSCSERALPIFRKVPLGNHTRGRWSLPVWDRASQGFGCSSKLGTLKASGQLWGC